MSVAAQPQALIVEDDEGIREVLRDLLEEAGYVVSEARDGAVALGILLASPQGLLVLLDNLLPGMDGEEVLAALAGDGTDGTAATDTTVSERGNTHAITRHAFVLMTASPQLISPGLVARLERMGTQVIAKPFDIEAMFAAVAQAAHHLTP